MNLADIQEQVHAAQEHCWDSEIFLGELTDGYIGKFDMAFDQQMTAVARHELLSKVGVPTNFHGKPFFDQLAPWTQVAVVQDAVKTKRDKAVLARWYGDTLRAVVSGDYTCVPHTSVVDVLQRFPKLEVKNFYPSKFGPETKTMHIRLTTNTVHSLNGNGDIGQTMIHIVNSEIGKSSLIVDAGIWREVCTNGLFARIGGTLLLKERHLYHDPDDLLEVFETAVEQAEEVALEFLDKLRAARETQVPVEQVLDRLPSDRMRDQVRERLEGDTLFDVYNGITSAAQERVFTAQVQWEQWARRLLDHPFPQCVQMCPSCGRTSG
jgi:hypothetical protein